ncbi:MAG: Rab family GTPase [Candidatus Njordarchaeales archaeon]
MLKMISKIVFIGDGGVGKSSLVKKYLEGTLSNTITLGVDFHYIQANDQVFVLWDFSGQKRFRELIENLVVGASVIVMVFDLSRPRTLFNLLKWANMIRKKLKNDVKVIVVGNKKDLGARVDDELLKKFLSNFPLEVVTYIETSAKTGENVALLFQKIVEVANKKPLRSIQLSIG